MTASPSDFVHLHVHSEYSLLDGANRIADVIAHAKSLGQQALALTDHGVMFGAHEFYETARQEGVKPIIGCEVYITPNGRTVRGPGEQKNTHHLLLLAENFEGYKNLMKLSSRGHTEGYYYKPRIDFELLNQYKGGLIATSSCLAGLIPQAILNRDEKKAAHWTGQFMEMFGRERFFIEIQDHGIPEQHESNRELIKIARAQDLRLIATNDAHYMRREDAEIHDVLLCVQTGCTLHQPDRMKFFGQEFYIKSAAEMAALFPDHPEAITNTRLVAEMCDLQFPKKEYHLPRFKWTDGLSEADFFVKSVWEGARKRYAGRVDSDTVLRDRIEFEISVILKMGFAAYFLIVADFIAYARSVDIPVGPGRGSAAGSVVAYAMQITQLCPLQHGLLFERFLNPDRLSMPDIDVDFSDERRGEVIEYVRKKYGEECVSQIVTFGTMQAKAAIRDVGRVMGLELKRVDQVAKLLPPKLDLSAAVKESAELKALLDSDKQLQKLYNYATQLEGMSRHASTHAAGVVIADRDLTEYVPLYKTPKEIGALTQFTMGQVEEIGLLKMDFLGIKNLSIIQRVEKWLLERDAIRVDWDAINLIDGNTYHCLHRGQTAGVFQLESAGMTALVKAMKPTNFADLTALIALYRPGPLQANMHMVYVNRKHGRERVTYDHPVLESILRETYGIFIYQEQVMIVAMEMCGFTRGDADVLRKAMGKKKKEVMDQQEDKFLSGALKTHDIPRDQAKHIWDQIVTFAGYGFNKSHSAAYAVVTFQTAYLRANFPTYFQAALLTNELGGSTDNIARYVANAREVGLQVLPADVNRSLQYFNPDGKKIYYALGAVKTVGENLVAAILAERTAKGPFKNIQDFMVRVPSQAMNSRMIEALIKVGAFDSLHTNRAALLLALPDLMELAQDKQKDSGPDMFEVSEGGTLDFDDVRLPIATDWDQKTRANFEKEFLGFFLSEHPLNKFKVELSSFNHTRSSQLAELAEPLVGEDSANVQLLGSVASVQVRTGSSGQPWAIVVMEDLEGTFEVKFWAKSFEKFRKLLEPDRVLQVSGRLGKWQERPSLEIFEARPAEELRENANGVELEFEAEEIGVEMLRDLKALCRRYGGRRQLAIRITHEAAGDVIFKLNGDFRVGLTEAALKDLAELKGRPRVRFTA